METQKPLLKDENGEEVDVHMYRSMIGSLMYLTSSRPDIMFVVCACARYQVNPKVLHLHAIKKIFRYLKGQPKLGLWYLKDSPFDLVAYIDSDYAGASLDRKSTTGGKAKKSVSLNRVFGRRKELREEESLKTEREYVVVKTVNGEEQLHALVDGKKIIIIESTVRRDLQLEDGEGIDCLPNSTIFEQLALRSEKTAAWNLDNACRICDVSEVVVQRQETIGDIIAQTRVLDLETTKTTQANEIASLKRRVKKLEKKDRSRTHKLKRLYKVGLSTRAESSKYEGLGEEDASK
ncbi:hypothetical protein Tco_0442811 [Tanacetum coccineum]